MGVIIGSTSKISGVTDLQDFLGSDKDTEAIGQKHESHNSECIKLHF